jgi:hypothetical protein
MRKFILFTTAVAFCLLNQPLQAWFDGGHMMVAYIAYKNLSRHTRSRVDTLLKLNPMYTAWIKDVPAKQRGVTAFLRAATWPDCIKQSSCSPGYKSDGGNTPPGSPSDDQNIGYSDKLMHKYWHFVDVPYEAGSPGMPAPTPNALTEIKLLTNAIASNESDDAKSYDVAWLEHLVGDIHQPLHATARFTKNHPKGDAGGNFVPFCAKPCNDELHAYWDGLLGDKPPISQVVSDGNKLLAAGAPAGSDNLAPDAWVQASLDLARTKVYIPPISDDNDPSMPISPRPDPPYAAQALSVAQVQVELAGRRLAALLNQNLK